MSLQVKPDGTVQREAFVEQHQYTPTCCFSATFGGVGGASRELELTRTAI